MNKLRKFGKIIGKAGTVQEKYGISTAFKKFGSVRTIHD